MNTQKFILVLALAAFSFSGFCQKKITSEEKQAVVNRLGELMDSIYVFPEVAREATAFLKEKEQKGSYRSVTTAGEFANAINRDLLLKTNDLHINLKFDPEAIARDKNQTSTIDKAAGTYEGLKAENFGFKEIKILEGNIGYIDLRIFISPEYAGETATAAMNFLANTDAIIFDLRNHRGGSSQMIQLIQSYLFGTEPVHLNNFYYGPAKKDMQTWTLAHVPGKRNPDADVYVLTGKRSFSAAEEFAYNIKNLKRGTLIGETTGGAANPGRTHNVDDSFTIFIPSGRAYSPVTNTNWEGTGVSPHIPASEEESLDLAYRMALKNLSRKTGDDKKKAFYDWHLKNLKVTSDPVILTAAQLRSYTGSYGGSSICFENNTLVYDKGVQLVLIPLGNDEFVLRDKPKIRLKFSEDRKQMQEVFISGKKRTFYKE